MAVGDDRALMDEQVLRAVIGGDEAEALLVVEPLHGSCRHVNSSTGLGASDCGGCGEATTAGAGTSYTTHRCAADTDGSSERGVATARMVLDSVGAPPYVAPVVRSEDQTIPA